MDVRLALLSILTDFRTDEIGIAEITAAVEAVRSDIYAQQQPHVMIGAI